MKKEISKATHLQARGLFTLAAAHYKKMREAELAMIELLGFEDEGYGGCLSDEVYSDDPNFDRGMKKEGFTIAPDRKQQS